MIQITKLPLRTIVIFLSLLGSSSLLAQEVNDLKSTQRNSADTGGTQSEVKESKGLFAFVNVNVVPMDREIVLPNQTVIVRDGKIVSIASTSDADVPASATHIDGTGRYLMPGMADMHVHISPDDTDELVVFVANGITTVRNMFGDSVHLVWRDRIEKGSLFGPTIYTTGPITDGDPPYWSGSAVVTTPEAAKKEVLAQIEAGYDGVKVFDGLLPEVYETILATAAEHDFPVYGHVPARVGMLRALELGQKSFEHMNDFLYALMPDDAPARAGVIDAAADKSKMSLQTVLIHPFKSADANRIPQVVAKFVEYDAWLCPTLQLLNNMSSTKEEFQTLKELPEMRYIAAQYTAYWDQFEAMLTSEEGNPAVLKDAYKLALRSVKAMHDAGAHLVVGTDTPNPYLVPGFSLHQELQCFVEAGLTPYEAIKAATHDAAELVGALNEWGAIAVGKRADLILVSANPLDRVENTSKQVGVMAAGCWFPKQKLNSMLDEVARKYLEQESENPATGNEEK